MTRLRAACFVLVVACSAEVAAPPAATAPTTITTTTSPVSTSTSTSAPPAIETGHLMRLDLPSLEPVGGVDPISIVRDTSSLSSPDGSLLLVFKWDEAAQMSHVRTIDVHEWRQIGSFDLGPTAGMAIDGNLLFAFNYQSGELVRVDLLTGDESVIADWSPHHWLWEGPHTLPGHRIAALVAEPVAPGIVAEYHAFVFDTETHLSAEHPVGILERVNPATGIFDGDREIPDTDHPGLAWRDDRLFVAYMDGPEVVEVDLETGDIKSHPIELVGGIGCWRLGCRLRPPRGRRWEPSAAPRFHRTAGTSS